MFGDLITKLKTDKKLALIAAVSVAGFAGALITSYFTFFSGPPKEQKSVSLVVPKGAVQGKDNASAKKKAAADNKTGDNRTVDNKTAVAVVTKTPGAYQYNAAGRRDPFMPLIVVKTVAEKRKKGATPLEDNDVPNIKLIAIMWSKAGYYALVTLPDGKSYTIREGVKLGLNDGKVYKITKDSVIIRELVRNQVGVLNPKDSILKLRGGEE